MKKLIILMVFLLAAVPAFAEKKDKTIPDPLSLRTDGYLVKTQTVDGKQVEKLVALPKEVAPGEVIQYNMVGKNTTAKPLQNVEVVGGINKAVFADKSAKGPAGGTQFSIDGGKTYAKPPIKEKVKLPNGKIEERVVPVSRYTNIKFIIGNLDAGQEFTYTYRVEVR